MDNFLSTVSPRLPQAFARAQVLNGGMVDPLEPKKWGPVPSNPEARAEVGPRMIRSGDSRISVVHGVTGFDSVAISSRNTGYATVKPQFSAERPSLRNVEVAMERVTPTHRNQCRPRGMEMLDTGTLYLSEIVQLLLLIGSDSRRREASIQEMYVTPDRQTPGVIPQWNVGAEHVSVWTVPFLSDSCEGYEQPNPRCRLSHKKLQTE